MNSYVIVDGELYHVGVKGMKWGRRKARPVATGNQRAGRAAQPADQAAQKQARKRESQESSR